METSFRFIQLFIYLFFSNFMEMIKCHFCFNTVVWEIMSDGMVNLSKYV